MKRKWQIIVGLVLSLITLVSIAAPVLAQEDTEGVITDAAPPRGALAIIAPWTVSAGKEFTVRVFLRENQEPFSGAGVWLIGTEAAATLKEELEQFKKRSAESDIEADYESFIGKHGAYLGRTGEDGRLACAIDRPGRYLLVAARNGFLPGLTHIGIRDTVKALGIKAPRRAAAGRPVTIMVFERITQNPVENSAVFAVTRDNAETFQQAAQALREDTAIAAEEKDYEALCNLYGFFIGRTDGNGKLEYTFDEAGNYLLVAVKRGYFPGFSPLAVVNLPRALGIKAVPPRTYVGRDVTLNVFARGTQDPIEGAGVWAIGRDEADTLREEIASLNQDNSSAAEEDYEAIVSVYGAFLGNTDENGKLVAGFDTAGIYVLVAVKRGYIPGFTVLAVNEKPEPSTDNVTLMPQKQSNLKPFKADAIELR